MFFSDNNDLINSLNTGQILSGLDFGDKTIGVAISDRSLIIGSPLKTISRKGGNKDIISLKTIFDAYNVGGIIIGLPLSLDGKENERTIKTREFGEKLYNNLSLGIYYQDERYSTDIVFKQMNNNITKRKISKYIDKSAAAYILQGFLDKYNYLNDYINS